MSKNKCSVDGCESNVVSKGLCDKHRKRLARHGHTNQTRPDDWGKREAHPLYKYWTDTIRKTTFLICNEWLDDFWKFVEDVKERPDNHHIRPKTLAEKLRANNYIWVPEKPRELNKRKPNPNRKTRNRVYLSRVERLSLYEKADYKCQICGKDGGENDFVSGYKKSLCIDHCHETLKIRGVLCGSCNKGLGLFKDDVELLKSAIDYIRDNID